MGNRRERERERDNQRIGKEERRKKERECVKKYIYI